jgi:TPR repeat protein
VLFTGLSLTGCGGNGPLYLVNTEIARVYFLLGESNEYGITSNQDYPRAARYYRKSCSWSTRSEWGRSGCARLAKFSDLGLGVPVDHGRAAALHEEACQGGRARSCYPLGRKYHVGSGVAKDMGEPCIGISTPVIIQSLRPAIISG